LATEADGVRHEEVEEAEELQEEAVVVPKEAQRR
jgi:hypothetical protein